MLIRIFTLLLLGGALLLAACGDDEEELPNGDPTETPAATETEPPNGETPAPTETPPANDPTPTETPDPEPATQAAVEALASWLGPVGDPASIEVDSVETAIWSDGCLGLGHGDEACTDALVEGFRVDLTLGDGEYEVRTDVTGDLTRWAPSVEVLVTFEEGLTNLFLFTTDDGNELEAQPVAGTDYAVDPQTLSSGDPVGIALADAPQDGPQLLVWIESAEE